MGNSSEANKKAIQEEILLYRLFTDFAKRMRVLALHARGHDTAHKVALSKEKDQDLGYDVDQGASGL
ncbi:hypothetical protein KSD_64900 [Ktedonobacter sp. SOSP1-85]|nr:hypothetical protein KSD_64900 [Ktedonobacter sp. SOSP1-85]